MTVMGFVICMIVNKRPGWSKTKNICTLTPVGPDQASLLPPPNMSPA